ncbi:leucyl aminopeptidase family protein [Actinoplanes sp. LDG1-06]|uniref:Probable cytosol aminopeptidase n=1 Tax=Paractinoplanes ovalisporus TaxID=2810368 RepID=A0ABS2A745_9ACTN|nr:leucyl aminopeptidase family protein [Actinoplanes ovalisporus]MBM2615655.1 leucyl aminopeptidase family protein [Actinoplanes ovalisporus]
MTSTNRRDRAAEIAAAADAVITGTGPVAIDIGPASRRIEFLPGVVDYDPWAPAVETRRGLGDLSVESARRAGTEAGALLTGGPIGVTCPPELAAPIVDGLITGAAPGVEATLLVDEPLLPAALRGQLAADVARLTRLLVSAPANVLTPAAAASLARRIADNAGLTCSVLGPAEVAAQGFGGLAAIGGGSANGPHLVTLDHLPEAGPPEVALVGKGITFDSGGLSLKSPAAMQNMRLDVAGAATVLAVMAGLRRAGCTIGVRAVLPFAENLPGPGAARPGDVVTAWNGTEIQILDTDFEGRVILADALSLAADASPRLLVDLATLTYQAEIALGPEIAAVFGRSDAAAPVLAAASRAGEPVWELPYDERYLPQIKTGSGVRNHPLHDSGRAITAALFLGEFVPRTVPWVHIDMTGPAWSGNASIDGATGFGARTLLELLHPAASA